MIVFILYSLVLLALIYYNGFFGLFKDNRISTTQFTGLFFFKILAIPTFYLVYKIMYGGLERFDSGIFYRDAKAVNDFAKTDFIEYLKMMFGLQDDSQGSYVYNHCLVNTYNWDNGRIRDYLYNDNRIVIRIHSVLHFIAFNSYFAHALFSCFLSFIGIFNLYRSVKEFFARKEFIVLLILCFFPALWFYTGALLKEGLTIFFFGCLIWQLKKFIYGTRDLKNVLWLLFLLFISLLLKPYLLFFAAICFSLFFIIYRANIKHKLLVFFSILVVCVVSVNVISVALKNKSLVKAALARQRVFADAAKGGIFLLDSVKFVRLEFDSTLVKKVSGKEKRFNIKKDSPYIYWEHTHQQDTLFCDKNTDTLTQYKLVYQLAESGSNFGLENYTRSIPGIITTCLYYGLFYPLFMNAKNALQLLASAENLALIIALILFVIGVFKNKKDHFPPVFFVFFALSVCLLIGLTTPNSGAIFRYRSPVVIFILLAALYYSAPLSRKFFKRRD